MAYIDTQLKIDEIAPGESRFVEIGEFPVGLFRTAEGVFALNNICPHRGAPLHDGFVQNGQVTCPWHQWQFGLADGVCRNIKGPRVAAYPVEIRDGTVWVDLE
jgi:NAD(P)H-dependent nitrite reductase small subunit